MSELAIVIPAYKANYLDKALLSIANQSCKDFTLYIGNDCSPYNLKSIVDPYQDQINIVYKHFDTNIGGKDLVAQWERCIDLVKDENWIWLFSDDDLMDPLCVEYFYRTLDQYPCYDLFHFNVTHVDDDRGILNKLPEYPEVLTAEEFIAYSFNGHYSFVVEYIFRKSHFYKLGRFQQFDLAWFSDIATWIKLGKRAGIRTIRDANVYFRTSPFNLTPIVRDKEILKRKFNSQIQYSIWIYDQVKQKKIQLDPLQIKSQLERWFYSSVKSKIEFVSFGLLVKLICLYNSSLNQDSRPLGKIMILSGYKVYRFFLNILKKVFFWEYIKLLRTKFRIA